MKPIDPFNMENTNSIMHESRFLYIFLRLSLHIAFTLLVSMTFTLFSDKTGIRRDGQNRTGRRERTLLQIVSEIGEREKEKGRGDWEGESGQGTCIE